MTTPFDHEQTIPEGEHPLLAGRYRVVRRLGAGGMGEVHLVEDLKLDGRHFAVKLLPSFLAANKRAITGLKREALHAMELSHSHIVTVRGFEEMESGQPFLVMDYVDGETLEEILLEREQMSEAEVLRIFGPIAEALDYAHGRGVIHRDVKPSNIMIRQDGTPLIMDFGIAREAKETSTLVTGRESTSGTLPYMSPEQLRGKKPEASQDIYSLAATMWECLAGEPPFSRGDLRHQIETVEPELPAELDGLEFAGSLLNGLSKDSAERPESCGALLGETTPVPAGQRVTPSLTKSNSPGKKPRSATDLVELESHVRILQREAKAALDGGDPLPPEYAAKFERAGHFVESAKENKLGRLWSDAASVLELASEIYEEIRTARSPYDALRDSQAKIEEIDAALMENGAELELEDLPKEQAYRVARAELDGQIEESVTASDWSAACETANAIIDLSSEHRKWVRALQTAREETLHALADVPRLDEELVSLGAGLDLDADAKSRAYRSSRFELDDRLKAEMESQAWREARDTAEDLIALVTSQRGHLQGMSAAHQRIASLRDEIELSDQRLSAIASLVDLSMVPEVKDFLSERDELEDDLETNLQAGEWRAAESTLSELCELLDTHLAWAEDMSNEHRKVMELDDEIVRLDGEIASSGTEAELGNPARFEAFRSARARLASELFEPIASGDWLEARTTSESIRSLAAGHLSWILGTTKARDEVISLQKEIDGIIADTDEIKFDLGSGFNLTPSLRECLSRQAESKNRLEVHVSGVDWKAAVSEACVLHRLVLANLSETSAEAKAYQTTIAATEEAAAARRRWYGKLAATSAGLVAIVIFVSWLLTPIPPLTVSQVGAGGNVTFAVLADGSVACWGRNGDGQCTVPSGVGTLANPVVEVAAGYGYTVAVLSDGSVACWGSNRSGQCTVPSGVGTPANQVVQVAAGSQHTVAVLSDGSVACWGSNRSGQCTVPSGVGTPANPVVQVAAGSLHTVAVLLDGSVACWGRNGDGQCTVPSGVGTLANPVVEVAAGYGYTVAVLSDGSVACWGSNRSGQCTVPSGVGTPANQVVQVAAGSQHTVAVLSDGSVACWGSNRSDQCTVPRGVGTPANPVVQVAAGDSHTVAVLSDGSVACWGSNRSGQCTIPKMSVTHPGDGPMEAYRLRAAKLESARPAARAEAAGANHRTVAAGLNHTVAVLSDGSVASWGGNLNGQHAVPSGVGTPANPVVQAAAGGFHTVAVLSDGSVACWGSNNRGQLMVPSGVGTPANPVVQAAAGGFHTVAVLSDGSVACWGYNGSGQCTVPSGVGTPANPVVQVAAGGSHTLAVLSDGSVACWGNNGSGQCTVPSGVGTPANPVVQVAAGGFHTVAVLSDGSVACWGNRGNGECSVPSGVGTPANPVVQAAAGGFHTAAVLSDGSVACWGSNRSDQCTVPSGVGTPANPVVEVAAGDSHTVALLADGSVACWGGNGKGQCDVPALAFQNVDHSRISAAEGVDGERTEAERRGPERIDADLLKTERDRIMVRFQDHMTDSISSYDEGNYRDSRMHAMAARLYVERNQEMISALRSESMMKQVDSMLGRIATAEQLESLAKDEAQRVSIPSAFSSALGAKDSDPSAPTTTVRTGVAEVGGLVFSTPPTWVASPPRMRSSVLQYEVPGVSEQDGPAELVFSRFDGTDGGPTEMNIDRWAGQFQTPEGNQVENEITEYETGDMKITRIETAGEYQSMGAAGPRVDQRLIGAIIEVPGERVFIRFLGPTETVEANRSDFDAMVNGVTFANRLGMISVPPNAWRSGGPIEAEGLEITTRRLAISLVSWIAYEPSDDPIVRVEFDRSGKPKKASLVVGSGEPELDERLLDAIYRWRARGDRLSELNGEETLTIKVRLLL